MERPSPPQAARDWLFPGGVNSYGDARVPAGVFVRGWNVVIRGGVLQTRYGTRVLTPLPPGRPQCLTEFSPLRGHKQLIAVIDGGVYVLEHPFTRWRRLPDVQMSARADVVYHATCVQVTTRDSAGRVTFLDSPRRVLVLQDGLSPAGWYDGYDHGNDTSVDGIPLGTRMAWCENRLWVARRNEVYASDFANPRSFVERFYLGEADSLVYPDEVTAMQATSGPSQAESQLVVWTNTDAYVVSAAVRRQDWPATPNFSRRMFRIGCISQRSVVEHEGKLWWMTSNGMTSLDEAAQTQVSAATPVVDRAMTWSREIADTREQRAAGAVAKGLILMSVAAGEQHNNHTWCLDAAVTHELGQPARAAWASVWTGFNPVEWVTLRDSGAERVFALCSIPETGENMLVEAMLPDRRDSGQDIECAVELRTVASEDPQLKALSYAEVMLSEVRGAVDLAVAYRGLARSRYLRILEARALAAEGSFRPDAEISVEDDTVIEAFGPQMRRWRTTEPRELDVAEVDGTSAQLPHRPDIDYGFSFLITWCGRAALRDFGVVLTSRHDGNAGAPSVVETEETVVRWDGATGPVATLGEYPPAVYSAQAVANAEWADTLGVTVTRRSLISEAAATRMATQAAEAQVDYWRSKRAPAILGGVV